jgi:hypothetical protein
MGADFVYAITELPPGNLDTELLCARIEQIVRSNTNVSAELYEQIGFADDIDDTEMIKRVCDYLRQLRNGYYDRCLGFLDTYDKDGNKVTLTLAGQMTWGDVDESLDVLWALNCLPEKWWAGMSTTAIVPIDATRGGWDWLGMYAERDTKEDN